MILAISKKIVGNQDGMALITVILVTALVAMLAVNMTSAQHIAIRRTANLLEGDQAMALALGLEEWGKQVLIRDIENQQNNTDNLGENWAIGLMPTAVDNGLISGSFIDLQGRINLNNLAFPTSNADLQRTEDMLERLFNLCGADDGELLVTALEDWLDDDGNTLPGGAEDNEYLLAEPPYLAANQPMKSPSELMLVQGVTPEIYSCVKDSISTLPEYTKININTAGPVVISTLSDNLTVEDGEEIVGDRPEEGYTDISEFRAHPAIAGSGITNFDDLDLKTDYFLAHGNAVFGESEIELYSVISRKSIPLEILGRSIGTY